MREMPKIVQILSFFFFFACIAGKIKEGFYARILRKEQNNGIDLIPGRALRTISDKLMEDGIYICTQIHQWNNDRIHMAMTT